MHRLSLVCVLAACGGGGGGQDGNADAHVDGPASDTTVQAGIWHPAPATTWQWQLTGTIDTTVNATMFDIDLFEAPQQVIDDLHAAGRIVICYFSAGSYEDFRSDAAMFPSAALGNDLPDWPGEKWLDTANATVRTIMQMRLDLAVTKHCDGVEPDNVDGYANDSGFALTASTQLDYNRFLAAQAHARGLSVGLKNDLDQVTDLVGNFDWALDEECAQYDECSMLTPFITAGKAVFHVEYGDASLASTVCPVTQPLMFSTLIKHLALDAFRVTCP